MRERLRRSSASQKRLLLRLQRDAQRHSCGATVSRLSDIETRIAGRDGEQLEIVLVEQVARPEENRPSLACSKPYPRIEQLVAIDDEIARVAGARGKGGAIAHIDRAEHLSGLAEQCLRPGILATDREGPFGNSRQHRARDVLRRRTASLLERRRRVREREVAPI